MQTSKIAILVGSLILASSLTACGSGGEEGAAPAAVVTSNESPVTSSPATAPATSSPAAVPVGGGYPAPSTATEAAPQTGGSTVVQVPVTYVPSTQVQAPTTETSSSTPPVASAPAVVPAVNVAPTISGSPATTARVGVAYSFQPTAADANGDRLTFSITGKPAWASFDANTGRLTGTPATGDIGNFGNISIKVSDGKLSATLASYAILVSASNNGSATLSWTPPTQNTDGTALSNLGGYRIYYGTQADQLTQSIQVTNPGLTSYTVGSLTPGKYYFAIAAYTTDGVEGSPSAVGSKTL